MVHRMVTAKFPAIENPCGVKSAIAGNCFYER